MTELHIAALDAAADYASERADAQRPLSDLEQLRVLAINLGEVESDLEPLEAERKALREQIDPIIRRVGSQTLPGFGAMSITQGGESVTWETRALDKLISELVATGDTDHLRIANRIALARKVTRRASSLKIVREK